MKYWIYIIGWILHDCFLDTETKRWSYKPAKAKWQLVPRSGAKILPDYIPASIRADYREACATCEASPRASAAFARRCLQGMIRDFWQVQKATLFDEVSSLKEKVDPLTWGAIEAIRKIGNIGAHMKSETDLIVDADPNEAQRLIYLIEILVGNWYVSRNETQKHLKKIASLGEKKEAEIAPEPEGASEE